MKCPICDKEMRQPSPQSDTIACYRDNGRLCYERWFKHEHRWIELTPTLECGVYKSYRDKVCCLNLWDTKKNCASLLLRQVNANELLQLPLTETEEWLEQIALRMWLL